MKSRPASRVLFAFAMALSASEASAFMGPNSDLFGFHEGKIAVISMNKSSRAARPAVIGIAGFQLSAAQVASAEEVSFEAHKERLVEYFRVVWPEESAWLETDEDLRREIDQAEADAKTLLNGEGELRIGDITSLAHVRVLRPDIMEDSWYWEQAKYERWQSRPGVLFTYILIDFSSLEERDYFFYQFDRYHRDNFGSLENYRGDVFPDLFMRERRP